VCECVCVIHIYMCACVCIHKHIRTRQDLGEAALVAVWRKGDTWV
jgi:hypothetical protein